MARRSRSRAEDDDLDSGDDKILREAKDRFKRCQEWESEFRRLYVMDVKFANADSDNGWQWPDDLRRDREANKRPALTINKTMRHVAMITNDARQNKPSVAIKPTGNESSFTSAQIYEGLVRDIEYKSGAQDIYDDATDSQVEGGIGWWRVAQVYPDDDSFDQELRIEPVKNHLNVYLDPDIKKKDGSDARFGFVFDELPEEEFKRTYPNIDLATLGSTTGLSESDIENWIKQDYIRIAEYYRLVETLDELYWVEDEQGNQSTFRKSKAPAGFEKLLVPGKFKKRKIVVKNLEWYKIAGNKIIDRRELKGQYIPLVRVVGIERVIDGALERKGFVRGLKDPQRMYNYNSSASVEFGALQTKTPFTGAAAAFEGNEVAWNNANRNNAAYLTFRHIDSDGVAIPAEALPRRVDPPNAASVFLEGMKIAASELEMVSGQYPAQMGQPSNERSGKAIAERQRQADTATYLFVNNLAMAIRYTGKIIIDLVPHIYDTKRVIQILGKDGTQSKVTVDPALEQAILQKQEGEVINVLFNPNVGKYEVESDVGPAYATQRQEAWNAFVQIVTGAPALIDEIGDLMFRSADFPLADKIAERLRRKIQANAPYLLEDGGPTPQMAQMQQALTAAQGQVGELIQKLAEKNLELKARDDENAIRRYDAESKRLTAETNSVVDLKKLGIELRELQMTMLQTMQQMQRFTLDGIPKGDTAPDEPTGPLVEGNDIPPFEGAQKAPDGNWYMPDPAREGKYLMVMH
ncbi:MAG TPA: portal protein [Pseudolabrys sp.]|nr:portal protein [Pseudolabrys sp.]